MSPTFTYDEINSDQSQVTDDGIRNVANVAADLACDLWKNYSDYTSSLPDPTGIGKFNNALYSRLCAPRGKTPVASPSLQFVGGQCAKYYNVTVSLKYGPIPNTLSTTVFNVLGPIKGIVTSGSNIAGNIRVGIGGGVDINHLDGFWSLLDGTKTNVLPYELVTFSVAPVSGPDNCGNQEPSYPVKSPPPTATKKNVNVNIGAGVVVPVVAVFAPVLFKPEVEINPQFQVDVGPFNVTFDAGGVTVAPNFEFSGGDKSVPPTTSDPNNPSVTKTPNNTVEECDLTPVTTRLDIIDDKVDALEPILDDIKDCSCPVGYEVSSVGGGSGNSGVVALPSRTIQVRLSLTDIPDNPKTIQNGGSDAPLQYFCGYYSFGDGSGLGARTAINVAQSVFEVPVWASSFSWSLYDGYSASVTFVTLVPEKAGAELASRQLKLAPT
jgi:hypothetical protein